MGITLTPLTAFTAFPRHGLNFDSGIGGHVSDRTWSFDLLSLDYRRVEHDWARF
ncbi:MAG TPA: hypothetical protein VGG46_08930 [Terriglobales bacterium]